MCSPPLLSVMKIVQSIVWPCVTNTFFSVLPCFAVSLVLKQDTGIERVGELLHKQLKLDEWRKFLLLVKDSDEDTNAQRGGRVNMLLCICYWHSLTPFWGVIFIKILCIRQGRKGWHITPLFSYFKIRNSAMFCGQMLLLCAFRTTVGLKIPEDLTLSPAEAPRS